MGHSELCARVEEGGHHCRLGVGVDDRPGICVCVGGGDGRDMCGLPNYAQQLLFIEPKQTKHTSLVPKLATNWKSQTVLLYMYL